MNDLPLIADVAIDCPGRDSYSYLVPAAMAAAIRPGDCVSVPFGPRRLRGFVISLERRQPSTEFVTRDIVDHQPEVTLPPHLLRLIQWGARYYRCSMGEFLAGAVPAPVREGAAPERQVIVAKTAGFVSTPTQPLNKRQQIVYDALPADPVLLTEACRAAATTRPAHR